MNILIVDDEYLEVEQLKYLIQKKYPFWRFFSAEDAVLAMKIVEKENVQLAFVDIRLPGKDGLSLAKHLKEQNEQLEVVIVSAHQEFSYAKKAIQTEVMDYLVKPVIEEELYQVIAKYLQENKLAVAKSAHVQYVLRRIENHYKQKLSLQEIAEEIPVNPAYLSHLFSEEIGLPFQEYMLNYRIHQAKKLIVDHPDWSINQISEESGFFSQHHFSNVFKKLEGVTPRKFKEHIT